MFLTERLKDKYIDYYRKKFQFIRKTKLILNSKQKRIQLLNIKCKSKLIEIELKITETYLILKIIRSQYKADGWSFSVKYFHSPISYICYSIISKC